MCWADGISCCTCSSMALEYDRSWHKGMEAVGHQAAGHRQCELQHFIPFKTPAGWHYLCCALTPFLPIQQLLESGCCKHFWHFRETGIILRVQKRKACRLVPGQGQVGVSGFLVCIFRGLAGCVGSPPTARERTPSLPPSWLRREFGLWLAGEGSCSRGV